MRAADYWDGALTVEEYLAQMTQRRGQFDERIAATEITPAWRAAFGRTPLRFLVLTEDYCGDSAQFIPPLIRLSRELGTVEIRILLRNSHQDLAAGYLRKDGYQPIPVIIVLDAEGNELGAIIERPLRMYDEMAAETRRFAHDNPQLEGVNRTYQQMPPETRAAVIENMERYRDSRSATYIEWLFEDLAAIASRTATPSIAD